MICARMLRSARATLWRQARRTRQQRPCGSLAADALPADDTYAEVVQQRQIKPPEFYEQHAVRVGNPARSLAKLAGNFYPLQAQRHYFFHVDLQVQSRHTPYARAATQPAQGRLFAEDVLPKNVATSLKSPAFLRFFFSNVRENRTGLHMDYPFVSPCARELNFVQPAATPVVFLDLQDKVLWATGELKQHFDPASIRVHAGTGRLFHPFQGRHWSGDALLCSHLALQLSHGFVFEDGGTADGGVMLEWGGERHRVHVVRRGD